MRIINRRSRELISFLNFSLVFMILFMGAIPTKTFAKTCSDIIPTGERTSYLTSSEVDWNISGEPSDSSVDAILNSIQVDGTLFTDLVMPDSVRYQFGDPQATSQYVRENGDTIAKITDGSTTFDPALLSANIDRNLRHYLSLDGSIQASDYVEFLYNTPFVSAQNRYIMVSERNGNNNMTINALDANGNIIGTDALSTAGETYIDTGFVTAENNQNIQFTIYPLTALVSAGENIYGIRVTQTGAPSDGGDGKVFIMYDPFSQTCISANDDDFSTSPIISATGGTTATLFSNDDANGTTPATDALIDDNITLTRDGGLSGLTVNTDGTITVPVGTRAGDYLLEYNICLDSNSSLCDRGDINLKITKDSDNDGVIDSIDLDDDNDGILDTVECKSDISTFKINETMRTNFNLPVSAQPIVGDVTGDGLPNIVVAKDKTGFVVLKGDGSDFNDSTNDIVIDLANRETDAPMSHPALADFDGDGIAEIVVAGSDDYIYIFKNGEGNVSSGNYWLKSNLPSNLPVRDYVHRGAGNIKIVDIDEDGTPEIIFGRSIFKFGANLTSLDRVIDGDQGSEPTGWSLYGDVLLEYESGVHIADVLSSNPGKELIVYNKVYGVDMTAGTLTTLISYPVTDADGINQVADVNGDGTLDVIVVEATQHKLHIWTPETNTTIMTVNSPGDNTQSIGIPTVYNIYDDRQDGFAVDLPEVFFTSSLHLTCYNVQKGTTPLWDLNTSDVSGQTRVTAFDFEGDGIGEIVYRDQSDLRIINGNSQTPINHAIFPASSITYAEGNVIADIDNDGHAEIIVVIGDTNNSKSSWGPLGIYDGTVAEPWKIAPNYWNELDYHISNINSDLTIPRTESIYSISNGQPIPAPFSCDSDNDGIPDILDLDSDNDGIPDNIEAQLTTGYTAPTGTPDANGTFASIYGVDGLIPVDTDEDNISDILDLDSDDDNLSDADESGLTLGGDIGINGLDNNIDTSDDYSDVNGKIDTPDSNLSNVDGNNSDVDYRSLKVANTPPIALDSNQTINIGTPLTLDLLSLVSDAETPENLYIVSINDENLTGSEQNITVPNGVVQIATDGTITFIPADGYTGDVTFPYETSDGTESVVANVNLTVIPSPELIVDMDTLTPIVSAGGDVTYRVVIKNIGGATATKVEVKDILPNGFTTMFEDLDQTYILDKANISNEGIILDISTTNDNGDTISFKSGWDIDVNGSVTIQFTVKAESLVTGVAPLGEYDNTIIVTSANYKTVDDNGTVAQDSDTLEGEDPENDEDVLVSLDTDKDGIPDVIDLDDDNDGILDTTENTCSTGDLLSNYSSIALESPGFNLIGQNVDTNILGLNISHQVSGVEIDRFVVYSDTFSGVDFKNYAFHSVDGNNTNPAMGTVSFTFNKPVLNLVHTVGDIDGLDETDFEKIQIHAFFEGNEVSPCSINIGDAISFDGTWYESNITAYEDNSSTMVTSKFCTFVDKLEVTLNSNWHAGTVSTFGSACTTLDSDDDNISNNLDLDSDNDGIPDNVEAQLTTGYIAPTGTLDANGTFASIYGVDGLIPVDTDEDNISDVLDLDSDNDGLSDSNESGLTLIGDVGINGLDNNVDTFDDYSDVNGKIDTPDSNLSNVDGNSSDVDYRSLKVVNTPPIALDSNQTINIGTRLTLDLLSLVSDAETPNALSIVSINDEDLTGSEQNIIVPNGVIQIATDGTITFIPADGYTGDVTFPYEASDGTESVVANVNLTIISDTDGDGIPDDIDLDDDNDGILDNKECVQYNWNFNVSSEGWKLELSSESGGLPKGNTVGFMVHSSDSVTNVGDCSPTIYPQSSDGNFILGNDPDGTWTWAISSDINADVSNALGGNLNFDYINGDLNGEGEAFTTLLRVILIGKDTNVTATFPEQNNKGWVNINIPLTEAEWGSDLLITLSNLKNIAIEIEGSNAINTTDCNANEYFGLDNISFKQSIVSCDTDLDNILNHLDLDSDNDGIPDNVEAQLTTGYLAPTGIPDENGTFASIYGPKGLIPVDTDEDNISDVLDLDSDNDGLSDSNESGLTLIGDVGINGLDNNVDTNDSYVDVNGKVDNPSSYLKNVDGSSDNVDYRSISYAVPAISDDNVTGNIGTFTTFNVLLNDVSSRDLNLSSVRIIDSDGSPVTSLFVPTEGTWEVDTTTGMVTFTPVEGYTENPTDVNYIVSDILGGVSNEGTINLEFPAIYDYSDAPTGMSDFNYSIAQHRVGSHSKLFIGATAPTFESKAMVDEWSSAFENSFGTKWSSGYSETNETTDTQLTSEDLETINESGDSDDGLEWNKWIVDKTCTGLLADGSVGTVTMTDTLYCTTVKVTNNSAISAQLVGWLDLNSDGKFDKISERSVVNVDADLSNDDTQGNVPAGSVNQDVVLMWIGEQPVEGEGFSSFVRLRFTTDPVFKSDHSPEPDNNASDGESEDSAVEVASATSITTVDDSDVFSVGTAVTVDVLANDINGTNDTNSSSVMIVDAEGNETKELVVNNEGTWSVEDNGSITFTPLSNFMSDATPINYIVYDTANEKSSVATVSLYIDSDGDGVGDTFDLDDDNDGIPDVIEQDGNATRDTDGDGIIDSLDLDSDNDGLLDLLESGQDVATVDVNGDGVLDSIVDADSDGLLDVADEDDSNSTSDGTVTPIDTDGDGVKDFQDVDSDNDGLSDLIEAGIPVTNDADNDGAIDGAVNPDGVPTVIGSITTPTDTDNDGVDDYRDLDSDNDGLTDLEESGATDSNDDGIVDTPNTLTDPAIFPDTDDDGTVDVKEPNNSNLPSTLDTDGDGVVDDTTDTDGDGIADVVDEADNGFGTTASIDTDGDGISDEYDFDDDNDGIRDVVELDGNSTRDTDGDGIIDSLDLDSDNDGIPDNIEAQPTSSYSEPTPTDTNGTFANYTPIDSDGDGIADYLDLDSDNDGISDTTESGLTLSGEIGNNGLDDAVESSDDYSDVNGDINAPATDLPNEVGDLSEVAYREAELTVIDEVGATINGSTGGISLSNVASNDSLGLTIITLGVDANITNIAGNTPLDINMTTGEVVVPPRTTADTYVETYTICENGNPTNCKDGNVTVEVTASPFIVNSDSNDSVNGSNGGVAIDNITSNDTLNGNPIELGVDANITSITNNTPLDINITTGAVTVPTGTEAGVYIETYTLCENLNPTNCIENNITVDVKPAPIDAVDDDFSSTPVISSLGGVVGDVTGDSNDILNGLAITDDLLVTLELVPEESNLTRVTLEDNGTLSVEANTTAGTYNVAYQLCEVLNPTNCDDANVTVVVDVSPITTLEDNGSVNGNSGGTAILNVTSNDKFSGNPLTLGADVNITTVTNNTPLDINKTTGEVSVPAKTPSGVYVESYTLCENLNPTNCVDTNITVTVASATITASNDNGSVSGINGGTAISNITSNDRLDGNIVTLGSRGDVNITSVTNNTPLSVSLSTGAVTVARGTRAGTYTEKYTICENLNPTNCVTASLSVTVSASPITASTDNGSINGYVGGTAISNITSNDRLNNSPVTLGSNGNVHIATVSNNTPLIVNQTTGDVTVPSRTKAGTYTETYTLCENLNPTNCTNTNIVVEVVSAPLAGANDIGSVNGYVGGTAIEDITENDNLNGEPVTLGTNGNVEITKVTNNTPLVVNETTGAVTVPSKTVAGTYTETYTLCETLNPTSCISKDIIVTVESSSLIGSIDSNESVNGSNGGTAISNVTSNDTLNGTPVILGTNVIIKNVTDNSLLVINPETGAVTVPRGTEAGRYTETYTLCETLNPSNCVDKEVIVIVSPAQIDAVDDDFSSTPISREGGIVGDVTSSDNDTLNGLDIEDSLVTLTLLPDESSLNDVTLDESGALYVSPNTTAGRYNVAYRLCEVLNPTNCDDANVTVVVGETKIVAVDDRNNSVDGTVGGVVINNIVENDTLNGNSIKLGVDVNITSMTHNTPLVIDLLTGSISLPAGTEAGEYTERYTICENLNPTNCDSAVITVVVGESNLVGVDDEVVVEGNLSQVVIPNIAENDTLNGTPVMLGINVNITSITNNTPLEIDVLTGEVTTPDGIASGTYTEEYTLCENSNPENCVIQTVTVKVIPVEEITITINETVPLNNGIIEVHGETEPFAEVTVTFPTGEEVTVQADENGNYVATSTTEQPLRGEISAVATNSNGETTPNPATSRYTDQTDTDGDGIPDSEDLDDDNDGIPDSVEGDGDTDNDGIPDSLDLDSDNDGILDILESGNLRANSEGRVDSSVDEDEDGLMDLADADDNDASSVGVVISPIDTDQDGKPDFQDVDSDNDGISDLVESGVDASNDIDNNGMLDGDVDEDGLSSSVNPTLNPRDTDRDGTPNHRDLDSDSDGISDVIEGSGRDDDFDGRIDDINTILDGSTLPDSNSNGRPDYIEPNGFVTDDSVYDIPLYSSITVDILANDMVESLNIETVKIEGTQNVGDSLVVDGEGEWSIEDNGSITFTPNSDFEFDPTPIRYSIENNGGTRVGTAIVAVHYASLVRPDVRVADLVKPVEVPVLDNDNGDLNVSSVQIVLPEGFMDLHPDAVLSQDSKILTVPNQGSWRVRSDGVIVYQAQEGVEVVDPTPISYAVFDMRGEELHTDALVTLHQPAVGGVSDTVEDCECEAYREDSIPAFQNIGLWLMLMTGFILGIILIRRENR